MTKVKICGIKRIEDIYYVNKYLPDYIGFVLAESKRRVWPKQVRELKKDLDTRVKTVGVFVNEDIEKTVEISTACGLDCIQLHGDENPQYLDTLRNSLKSHPSGSGVEIWKAVRVKDESSILLLELYKAEAFVLDAFVEGSYGGAGKLFDWNLANLAKTYGKIFLAGGLNADNVSNAVESVSPYGVDVSSGVETDGCKDESKIQCFMNKVRKKMA